MVPDICATCQRLCIKTRVKADVWLCDVWTNDPISGEEVLGHCMGIGNTKYGARLTHVLNLSYLSSIIITFLLLLLFQSRKIEYYLLMKHAWDESAQ